MGTPEGNYFEGLAEDIVKMLHFKPDPEHDDRVPAFTLSDEELAYLHGETDVIPPQPIE